MNDTPQNIQVKTESVQNIADSIRVKNHSNQKYKIGEMSGAIDELIVATPNTTKEITENGTYDVSSYTSANVQTPVPTGTKEITQNGTTNVKDYEFANVQVPQPSGTTSITQNGSYDVGQYRFADVNTPSYTPDSAIAISTNGQHNVGIYEYANVNVPTYDPDETLYINENGVQNCGGYGKVSVFIPDPPIPSGLRFYNTSLTTSDDINAFGEMLSHLDYTYCTSAYQMFYYLSLKINNIVQYFPITELPASFQPQTCYEMFRYSSIKSAPYFDTSLSTDFTQMFRNTTYLEDIPLYDTSSLGANGLQNMLASSGEYYTQDTVDNILQMCIATNSSTKKLQYLFGMGVTIPANVTNKAMSSQYYQDFLNAGWTLT